MNKSCDIINLIAPCQVPSLLLPTLQLLFYLLTGKKKLISVLSVRGINHRRWVKSQYYIWIFFFTIAFCPVKRLKKFNLEMKDVEIQILPLENLSSYLLWDILQISYCKLFLDLILLLKITIPHDKNIIVHVPSLAQS